MADSAKALLVQAQEEEHHRVARRLQDGPAQVLANAALEVETCLRLMDVQPSTARDGLTALAQELHQGLGDLREIIAELQPPLLDELGLVAALTRFIEDLARQTGLDIQLTGWDTLTERLPATMEMAIFRILQEALNNVREHARARRVRVNLQRAPELLTIVVRDDGRGFDNSRGAPTSRRLGLIAMHDRAELLSGNLQIFTESGKGVRVVLTIPLRATVPAH